MYELEPSAKRVLTGGKIYPQQGDFRYREQEWDKGGNTLHYLGEMKPLRTAQEAWGYIDGEVLE